jgi:hypothetical protein
MRMWKDFHIQAVRPCNIGFDCHRRSEARVDLLNNILGWSNNLDAFQPDGVIISTYPIVFYAPDTIP